MIANEVSAADEVRRLRSDGALPVTLFVGADASRFQLGFSIPAVDESESSERNRLVQRRLTEIPVPLRRTGSDLAKRSLDLFLVIVTAPIWLFLLAVLALVVKISSRGPAFFSQKRIGLHGRHYQCTKLRTMAIDAEDLLRELLADEDRRAEFDRAHKLRDDPRVTKIGRVLRKTGLDELPQLFAVLRGDMSLVGPRPIVDAETPYYGECLALMQSVRPGLTGLWQVSGHTDVEYCQRVAFDVEYALRRTVPLDVKILFMTILQMARPSRHGSY